MANKWDERFMEIARIVSSWSSCLRRNIGAVVVRDKRILTTGYNGAVEGTTSCAEKGFCVRKNKGIPSGQMTEVCYAVHAEQNAILQAAKLGLSLDGATLYCTHQPCCNCAKSIVNAGIKRVVYKNDYPDEMSIQIMQEAGIEVIKNG